MLRFPRNLNLALGATVFVAAGCGTRARDYTPSSQVARASLEAALSAWSEGRPPGTIDQSPMVQVVDTERRGGQILRSFEVLSETSLDAEGRCFLVRLALDNPAADERARFVVVGIDPIWVFRKEDYDQLAHWEHPMEVTQPTPVENQSSAETQPPATTTSSSATSNERS